MKARQLATIAESPHADLCVAGRELSVGLFQHVDQGGTDFLGLHRGVFNSEVDVSWLTWKYGMGDAQGHGVGAGLWDGAELIAHCGGVPRELLAGGREISGLQIGDVMVRPDWRGVLVRQGPFYHVSSHFYRHMVGKDSPFDVGYGFPNARHLKLAVTCGLLLDGGPIIAPCWEVSTYKEPQRWSWFWRVREQTGVVRTTVQVTEAAWFAMRLDLGRRDMLFGARSAHYIQWRYLAPPHTARYRFFSLERRWGGAPVGWMVLDVSNPGVAVWLDWIGPLVYMPAAWQGVMRMARELGKPEMSLWATSAVIDAAAAPKPRDATEAARLGIVNGSLPVALNTQRDNWWLMGGDTDFL